MGDSNRKETTEYLIKFYSNYRINNVNNLPITFPRMLLMYLRINHLLNTHSASLHTTVLFI